MVGAMHFQAMARNNAWSNHRLLNACRALTQDEFEPTRVSFFPSLQRTLNHIVFLNMPAASGADQGSQSMQQLPPEMVRYLKGVPADGMQFDFLIGSWDVNGVRYKPDGCVLIQYQGRWTASYLNGKRMIMDDFVTYSPTGDEVSSYVTLRTYSEVTGRWEMAGLSALQPAINAEWFGRLKDGEMHLEAIGKTPDGKTFRNRIRFFEIRASNFSWESTISIDDGKTWLRSASLTASKMP